MESLYDRQLGGFTQGLLKSNKKHLVQKFNFSCRYVDGVLSLNKSKILEFIDLNYPR